MSKRFAASIPFLTALLVLSWAAVREVGSAAGATPGAQVQPGTVIDRARSAAEVSTQASSGRSETKPAAPGAPARQEPEAEERRIDLTGRRDPFKLPPPPSVGRPGESMVGPLPPGIRGLVVGQLRLLGTVRLDVPNTMIAVVTNYTNRAYFLRENDIVFNGVVSKITPDSVIFMENYPDPSGAVRSREVVKRLGSAPGEGR